MEIMMKPSLKGDSAWRTRRYEDRLTVMTVDGSAITLLYCSYSHGIMCGVKGKENVRRAPYHTV